MAMSDEDKIKLIRLRIGDVPGSPFYPLFTDEEYQLMLDAVGGDVDKATIMAAISGAFQVSGISSREMIDDLQIENQIASNYMKALQFLVNNPVVRIPSGLMPWVAPDNSGACALREVSNLSCPDCHKPTGELIPCGCLQEG